ncbi:pyridoxamine 5'-phosphate oxidase [Bartonella sp. DGB2]|uniref:pyridoxamine 5'-phosphate oxidase n=1 Tax=Bartonella sp. DGB2 TaxID=3388426 RepID=UPI0039901C6E
MNDKTLISDSSSYNPFILFGQWLKEAEKHEINDANAMALATVDSTGLPDVRMVLLKEFDTRGFVFYTNYESTKGQQILHTMKAALCFHWKSLRRQIRIRGKIEQINDAQADHYYHSRPRGSQIGAWASKQSRPLESRFALEKAIAEYSLRYPTGEIPRPPYWSGFRLIPSSIEFWHDRTYRLHDRFYFTRPTEDGQWKKQRLYP